MTDGLSEDDYLDIVESIQKALMIEPFQPDVTDVVALIGAWRLQQREIERLRAALGKLLEACDHNLGGLREGPLSHARRAGADVLQNLPEPPKTPTPAEPPWYGYPYWPFARPEAKG